MPLTLGKTGRRETPSWSALNPIERAMLVIGSLACACISIWTGQLLGIPREPGFDGSLLASGSPVLGILVVLIALAVCLVIASLVAVMIEIESGVFCCCIGLVALAIRCGSVRPVLQYASGTSVFIAMAIELLLLAAGIFGIWFVLTRLFDRPEAAIMIIAPNEVTDATIGQKCMTLGVQVVVTGVLMLILVQTDAKPQALAGLSIAAFAGVLAAYMFTPLSEGIWFWTGPVLLGLIGYLLALFSGGATTTGDLHGWSAGLARATPLDYAGAGIGGALLGHWCSRRWAQPEETESETVPAQ
jgi:hypothetical protein